MTPQILTTLAIVAVAVLLFVSERLRMDLVALLVLAALALSGLVTASEALAGFSSPAVTTVWGVFILGGGLSRTGVARIIGRQVLRLAGSGEARLTAVIMLTAGAMSAFMNNVGVAALLLPVVITIARQTRRPPSRLLIPLAYGSLLGGMTTLIGTPPNILASDALRDFGQEPFRLFDFAPVGLVLVAAGVSFMVLIGRSLLPTRSPLQSLASADEGANNAKDPYGLEERLTLVVIPPAGRLAGKTLGQSRIGRALGLNILGLQRLGRKHMSVRADTILLGGDRLLALGRLDRLTMLRQVPYIVVDDDGAAVEWFRQRDISVAELRIQTGSSFIGQTVAQLDFRKRYGLNVMAIFHDGQPKFDFLQDLSLQQGDSLLLQGPEEKLALLKEEPSFRDTVSFRKPDASTVDEYHLSGHLLALRIPEGSPLVGRSLWDSNLGMTFDLVVLGIERVDGSQMVPDASTELQAGDFLLVQGDPEDLDVIRGLRELEIKQHLDMNQVQLETEEASLAEAVLAPRTRLANRTLRDVHFREKYGLNVLAIWRNGRAHRTDLASMTLQFGDAFLLYGPRDRVNMLGSEPDFLVLQEGAELPPRVSKAPLASLIMVGVVVSVLVGLLPISIAAVTGAALMILVGCLNMEEAYQFIDWRSVFLIAGMLPLGTALERSGTAQFLATGMIDLIGGFGPLVLMAGFFMLTSMASQFMPNAVVTVLMAPIVINSAADLGLSARALMMAVAVAASASFMSPVAHAANTLIMGPGGYRFADYLKIGAPLTLLILLLVLLILPLFWPLT